MRATPARFVLWFFAAFIAAAGFWGAFALGRRTAASGSVSSAPVVLAMKKIAQLATVEVEIADVVRYEEIRTLLMVFDFPKSATLRLRGRVMGGFDLQNPDFGITADGPGRVVYVRLPRPRLLALDPRFEWFDEKSGWINPITPEDRNRWMLWARGALGRAARDAGIEAKAVEQARELLSGSARAFGWTADVTVAGGDPAPPPLASKVVPFLP